MVIALNKWMEKDASNMKPLFYFEMKAYMCMYCEPFYMYCEPFYMLGGTAPIIIVIYSVV